MNQHGIFKLPYDLIANVSLYLDLCSNTSLMDTCQHFRYLYLSASYVWKHIWFDPHSDLHRVYSSLRKLDDQNGLRQHIRQVLMDDCDDPNFSPIIMIIKFPHLRYLSAKNRPENTNLEVDIKLLQEMLKFASVQPHSLPIQYVHVYHYQMDVEPHLQAYQKTWNKLSQHGHVQLDIRICDHMDALTHQPCQRIVCTTAQCWSCGYHFNHCWKCVSICDGCKIKRIPPLANDNQAKLKHQRKRIEQETDEFSVFA